MPPKLLLAILVLAAVSALPVPAVNSQNRQLSAKSPVANALERGDEAYDRKNYKEAMHWYRKAADQGDAKAENSIGYMYDNGFGVKQAAATALSWYRKAAEHGLASAQFNVGLDYDSGSGVARDPYQARVWMESTAKGGDEDARKWLASQPVVSGDLGSNEALEACLVKAIHMVEAKSHAQFSWSRATGKFCATILAANGARVNACEDPTSARMKTPRDVIGILFPVEGFDPKFAEEECENTK